MTTVTTYTLQVPGATITHDVRGPVPTTGRPPLLMIGQPMDAAGFATLASRFPEPTVAVTGLALVAAHPEDVHTLVAHGPPLLAVLPDAERALAAEARPRLVRHPSRRRRLPGRPAAVRVSNAVTRYQPDIRALRTAPTRVVIAAGVLSTGTITGRTSAALAEALGQPLTIFPSHHGGFLGGEHGQAGEPEAFAATLHDVLDRA